MGSCSSCHPSFAQAGAWCGDSVLPGRMVNYEYPATAVFEEPTVTLSEECAADLKLWKWALQQQFLLAGECFAYSVFRTQICFRLGIGCRILPLVPSGAAVWICAFGGGMICRPKNRANLRLR